MTFSRWHTGDGDWGLTVQVPSHGQLLSLLFAWVSLGPLGPLVRMWSTLWQNFNFKTKKVKHINPGNYHHRTDNTVTGPGNSRHYSCSGKWLEFNLISLGLSTSAVIMHCMTIPDQLMTRVPSMNQVTSDQTWKTKRDSSPILSTNALSSTKPWNEKRAPFFRFLWTKLQIKISKRGPFLWKFNRVIPPPQLMRFSFIPFLDL